MNIIKNTIMVGLVLLPSSVFAATDCRLVEYPDHFEAVCNGDEKPGTVQSQPVSRVQTTMTTQSPEPVTGQTAVTSLADAAKPPVVPRLSRRPIQENQAALIEAKAARNRLILEERQKEPYVTPVDAAPMQE